MDTSNQSETFYHKRRLPHLYQNNHPVFITWRIKFDLPNAIMSNLKEMKAEFDKKIKDLSDEYQTLQRYTYHKKVFGWLDTQLGINNKLPDVLHKPEIAEIVQNSLLLNNDNKYRLHAYCIMPNHVHVLITPFADRLQNGICLSEITKQWKGSSSRRINITLKRSGAFWAAESYDHIVRNELEFSRITQYILLNPVKANLVVNWTDWKFSWVDDSLADIMN